MRAMLTIMILVAGCSSVSESTVISKSSAGITLRAPLDLDIGGSALKRDVRMAETATAHCESLSKVSILTVSDNDNAYVTYTYECR